MSHKTYGLAYDLQLFADGGEGGVPAGDGNGSTQGVTDSPTDVKGVKNPLANVVYGKQEDSQLAGANGTTSTSETPEVDRNAKFEELIKGEFKDIYGKKVQDAVTKRLKSSKEKSDKYDALAPVLEMLAGKYGVKDTSDIASITKALEEDDSYYENEAFEKGVSVEQLKYIKKMERENASFKRQIEEAKNREQADKDVAMWIEQAEQAKTTYPNLDLGEELKDEQFVQLLKSGVDVGTAYLVRHHNEIVPQAMQMAVKQTEEKLANKIMANGSRPAENGIGNGSSAVVKSDVSKFTKADRDEIVRRVSNGERIVL